MEAKIIELINKHLLPDIIIYILKYFSRNIHESDTNLYLANLVTSDEIIESIYSAFKMFRDDIFVEDRDMKCWNVKSLQQCSKTADNRNSSPLDAACRFKYILRYIA